MKSSGDSIKQLMATFCQQHLSLLGVPYLVQWGKDQKIMKEISTVYGHEKTFTLILDFFRVAVHDDFLKKTGITVGIMKTQIPKLLLTANENKNKEEVGKL